VIVVDFHAEATSEKAAMGWYLNGRVTAVLGTHTHVPSADERILPNGTAFQTDVGMSGPYDSIIGVEKDLVLHKFLTGMPGKFEAAKGNPQMCATVVTCDPTSASCWENSGVSGVSGASGVWRPDALFLWRCEKGSEGHGRYWAQAPIGTHKKKGSPPKRTAFFDPGSGAFNGPRPPGNLPASSGRTANARGARVKALAPGDAQALPSSLPAVIRREGRFARMRQ
jgi:hypothetical protein